MKTHLLTGLILYLLGLLTGHLVFSSKSEPTSPLIGTNSIREPRSTSPPAEPPITIDQKTEETVQQTQQLAQEDPQQALQKALTLPSGTARQQSLLVALAQWASQDSQAAFAWLSSEEAAALPSFEHAYAVVMKQHIIADPDSASHLIEDMEASDLKTGFSAQLAQTLAEERDPQSAYNWAQKLKDSAAQLAATTTALQAMAQENAAHALELALVEPDSKMRNQLLDQVGLVMARLSPENTATQLTDFPKEVQPQIIKHIAGAWASQDPATARDWLTQLPLGPLRDGAIRRTLNHFNNQNPSDAFALASTVNDSAKRYGMMRESLLAWYSRNPQESLEALASNDRLTEEQKQQLTQDLQTHGQVPDFVVPE